MFDLNYFKYLLKKNKHTFIYIGIIFFAAYLFPLLGETVLDGIVASNKEAYVGNFATLVVITLIFTFILPFVNFNHKFNKRAIDLYDALPLRKEKSLLTILAFQAFELIVPLVILAVIGIMMIKGTCSDINRILGYGIPLIIIVMIINTAIIFKTNSIFDGITMLAAYHILPFILYATVFVILSTLIQVSSSFPLIDRITYLSPFVLYVKFITSNDFFWAGVLILVIYLLIASISLYLDYLNRKPEKVEGISDNLFAYRLIVKIYLFLVALMIASGRKDMGSTLTFTLLILLIAAFIFADFIYIRKIKINLRKVIQAVVLIVIAFGGVKFVELNRGFGLDKIYPTNYTNFTYSYYTNVVLKDADGKYYQGGLDFRFEGDKEKDKALVAKLQELQNTLADKNFDDHDFWVNPHLSVDYSIKGDVNEYGYTRYTTVANYTYKTEFKEIEHMFKDLDNIQFMGSVYSDDDELYGYREFTDYNEFLETFEIVSYGFIDY